MDLNKNLKRDTLINYAVKIVNMAISLLMVRLTINYLGDYKYGMWATILSVITIIAVGDMGIGNGLKNKATEALALNDRHGMKEYISTAYVCISVISAAIFVIGSVVLFIYRNTFSGEDGIGLTIFIMLISICINFVLSLVNSLLLAHQKSGIVSIGYLLNSFFLLIGVFTIRYLSPSSIVLLGLVYNLAMLFSIFIINIVFFSKNKALIPKIKYFRKDKIRDTMGISIKFFILQCTYIILYSSDNIIINRYISVESVTTYSVINKIYENINTLYSTLLFPVWSAVTFAYTKLDTSWLKQLVKKLLLSLGVLSGLLLILGIMLNTIVYIWLGKPIIYPNSMIIVFSLYSIIVGWNGIFSSIVNGTGKINLYVIVSIVVAIVNIPLSIFYSKTMGLGIFGIKLAPLTCQLLPAVVLPIQVMREFKKMDRKQ
jgi:O-antigen/teichoic acid export membrane protein